MCPSEPNLRLIETDPVGWDDEALRARIRETELVLLRIGSRARRAEDRWMEEVLRHDLARKRRMLETLTRG